MLGSSKFTREGVDGVMKELIGGRYFNDILSDELLVVAYDYNGEEPRFYSKYEASYDHTGVYNVTLNHATGASSAAPTFFDPKIIKIYGMDTMQIDGGIICNNPAFYAYMTAKHLHKHKNIRILSMGTGEKPFTKKDPNSLNKKSFMAMKDEFMMNMDTYTADNLLNHTLSAQNYLRLQIPTTLPMDKKDPVSIQALKDKGE